MNPFDHSASLTAGSTEVPKAPRVSARGAPYHAIFAAALLVVISCAIFGGSYPSLADSAVAVGAITNSPFTNAIPISAFRELTSRDPFWPIGYQKPLPKTTVVEKPVVEFKLEPIGVVGEGLGILNGGQIIEAGETYDYLAKDGKTKVKYKVLKINEDGVDAVYDGKVYHFKQVSSDVEKFKEKETP